MNEAVQTVPIVAAPPAPRMLKQSHGMAIFTYGSTIALAMALKGPLSTMFQTKEEAAKQDTAIALNTAQLIDLKATMDTNKKEIIEAVNSVMKPIAKDVDRHETRIVNLEFLQMNKGVKR